MNLNNERLLDLAKQAGLKKPYGSDTEYIGDFDWRDFARLVIKECADVASDGPKGAHPWHYGLLIEQHFGLD